LGGGGEDPAAANARGLLPVGRQGDAILIQLPDERRILIDGGANAEAHEFIRNKYRLDKPDNFIDFDAVIATHSDADHAAGLIPVLRDEKIAVRRFLHNGLFPGEFHRSGKRVIGLLDDPCEGPRGHLSPAMKRLALALDAARKNLPQAVAAMRAQGRETAPDAPLLCKRLDRSQELLEGFGGGDPRLEVLWPSASGEGEEASYAWYGSSAGETVNGNSVVLKLTHGEHSVLLAGDLNEPSMKEVAAAHGERLRAQVYKAAHHGSQHFDDGFLELVRPDAAIISAGDDRNDQHGHPRAELLGSIVHASRCRRPAIFVTDLACCYRPLSKMQMRSFKASSGQLYERSIQGVVHLRSDGKRMCLGTVFGRAGPEDGQGNAVWKWDWWMAD
jgi:hypothetical protein